MYYYKMFVIYTPLPSSLVEIEVDLVECAFKILILITALSKTFFNQLETLEDTIGFCEMTEYSKNLGVFSFSIKLFVL